MKINITHDKDFDSVKPLEQEVRGVLRMNDLMMWSRETGQVTCYVVVYKKGVQFKCVQEKDGKTYTNYFKSYDAVERHYKIITRRPHDAIR